jgi:hypothetical protein
MRLASRPKMHEINLHELGLNGKSYELSSRREYLASAYPGFQLPTIQGLQPLATRFLCESSASNQKEAV